MAGIYGGGKNLVGVRIDDVEILLVPRLVAEIELGEHALARLGNDGGEVEGTQGVRPLVQLLGQPGGEIQIDFHRVPDVGLLDLDGHGPVAVTQLRRIDLREGGGGERGFVKSGKHYLRFAAKRGDKHGLYLLKRQRADVALQFAQFEDQGLRQHIGPHGEELTELDERRAQFLRRKAETFVGGKRDRRLRQQSLPAGRQVQMTDQICETVLRQHAEDILGPAGMAQQIEGLHADLAEDFLRGVFGLRPSNSAMRASKAAMRALVAALEEEVRSLTRDSISPLTALNSLRP